MSVKAIQAKIVSPQPRLRDYLWATHRLFNEALAFAIKEMLAMKHGAKGPLAHCFGAETAEKFRAIYCDMMHESYGPLGLHLDPEENKKRREGRSQSAHAWMELATSKTSKRDSNSKTLHPKVIQLIRELLDAGHILFDRDVVWQFGGHSSGFRRLLFDVAARRIITNVQNEENHQELLKKRQREFHEWKAAERTKFAEFGKPLVEFQKYQQQRRGEAQRHVRQKVRELLRIDGAMTKGWRELRERLAGAENNPAEGTQRIKAWQAEDPRAVGDINFFLWLADKPRLWQWVDTMRRHNEFDADLEKLSRPVNFSYPRADERPEWFSFSESSPGHMYSFDSADTEFANLLAFLRGEAPLKVWLCVFVPNEDFVRWKEIETKRKKKQAVTDSDLAFLNGPIQWKDFQAGEGRVMPSVRPFFKNDPPLDLSRFSRCWVEYELKPDPRWREKVHYAGKGTRAKRRKGGGQKETHVFEFDWGFGPHEPIWRRIHKFGGAKLIYPSLLRRGVSPSRLQPFLYFSFELEPAAAPSKDFNVKFTGQQNGAVERDARKTKKRPKAPRLPPGLRVLAVDLGMRHLAIGTICEVNQDGRLVEWGQRTDGSPGQKLTNLVCPPLFLQLPGLEFRNLQRHEWEKVDLQKASAPRRSRLPRGERFAIGLTEHLDDMKDDRAKKAAHVVVEAAWKNHVHWIVFEDLEGFKPKQEWPRWMNRLLKNWGKSYFADTVERVAKDYGIRVWTVSPSYSSQVCAACGNVGARCSQVTAREAKTDSMKPKPLGLQAGKVQVLQLGKLFACPHCRRIVNADFNASLNLHRRFERSFDFADRYDLQRTNDGSMGYSYNGRRLVGKDFWRAAATDAQRFLNQKFKQGEVPPAGGWPTVKEDKKDEPEDEVPMEWPSSP